MHLITNRTLLAMQPDVLAAIDTDLAHALASWGPLSLHKTEQVIDALVERHDPDARRRTESVVRSRFVDIEHRGDGIGWLRGDVQSSDATLLDRRLTALAHTVCGSDPRTLDQRRADAVGALVAGHATLICGCGEPDCAAPQGAARPSVVMHVVAEAAALDAAAGTDLHGARPGDGGPEIVREPGHVAELIREATAARPKPPRGAPVGPAPSPGLVLGGPLVPAAIVADLAARGAAEIRPLIHPGDSPPEPRYRPSAALADFVRCRDLTCRFVGCDRPAECCDVDHTIPYDDGGPTHASNLKLLCRKHHLLKTFWRDRTGWRDEQYPDGTIVWTAPSGQKYRTRPGSRLLFPALCLPTGELPAAPTADRSPSGDRGAMMPLRPSTRAKDRAQRIEAERRRNRQARHAERPQHQPAYAAYSVPAPPGDDEPPPF